MAVPSDPMRFSQYFLYTTREVPSDAEVVSHQLMVRAGMLRKLAAGIYTYQPFGWRSVLKLIAIVRRELDRAGIIELSMPAVQPAELWQESGRWEKYGKELLRFADRHEREFCFGPTHEEVVTDLVRHSVKSYRQLPFNLYQIQTKFRDEIRPRFGLMRGREFLMKDAYSFDADEAGLEHAYRTMHDVYCRIFEACGLDYTVVEADTGAIGGSSSHEFMVLAETGESAVVRCPECAYAANVEKAEVAALPPAAGPSSDGDGPQEVSTPGMTTVSQVAAHLEVSPEQIVKTLIYETDDGPLAVAVRGDRELNVIKLANLLGSTRLELAGAETVERVSGAPVGFAGPVGLSTEVRLVADESVRRSEDFVSGANRADAHLRGVRWGRDAEPQAWADLLLAQPGDGCPRCATRLEHFRGIEVGHIFKLGREYSEAMGCTYSDERGVSHPMVMGCYGLGIGRTLAAALEQNHDGDGIVWPLPLSPFEVLLIALNPSDGAVREAAEGLYRELQEAGIEVLFDDRDERPGVKFKDGDLIGLPVRVVVGAKSLAAGAVEVSLRRDRERSAVPVAEALGAVREHLERLAPCE